VSDAASLPNPTKKIVWAGVIAVPFLLSIYAAFRGGYIGPDSYTHLGRLTEWPKIFDFSASNPPGYYLFGYGLFCVIGSNTAFPIALSILQAGSNAVALWYFFVYSERRFQSDLVRLAFVFFLAFLPVRVIHATTLGPDCVTIPFFIILLFLFDNFLIEETSTWQNAALLGFALAAAIFTKYSFMALIPAILVVFTFFAVNRRWKLQRYIAISVFGLLLPSIISAHSFWASSRVHGYNTEKHWLAKGGAPDMDFKDLFSLKADDLQLFRAPEYFKREILASHKHSYLALSQMATFTDPMNLFQDLSVPQQFGAVLLPDQKTRRPWKTPVMQISMSIGVVWTLLALAGTAWTFLLATKKLLRDKLEREDITAILGTACFLVIFLPIPFVHGGALFGYWTPRLILPALLYFFWAAFLLVDRKIARRPIIAVAAFVLVLIQCTIEAVILI
jgi:ABC-type nickel/cobalt efflux system permease component RcnA